ncbi:HEAT repeat domain-containing protein [Cerasicoccus frondis]|uniref:HEAT repeat domain-containing protein n=1 Tax=Cerasicoccus frondis TaxID=490090 RepID=UPI002852A6FF|nr:HEAT repeat domain-containing protein [Cerasicoccus frondis]
MSPSNTKDPLIKKAKPQSRLLGGVQPDDIRQRYETSTGVVRRMFDHLIEVARDPERISTHGVLSTAQISAGMVHPLHRPDETCYAFLALLLTGESIFADLGKERLRLVLNDLGDREISNCCQLHTWCDAFPMVRYAIYLSWLNDLGYLTEEENSKARDKLLSYTRFHPFERLRSRYRPPKSPNNQNGSMGLACVVTALLFKEGGEFDPRVRDILNLGLKHLIDFVTGFPLGGYSGEGSGYNLGVNAFLLVTGLEILESATSQNWLNVRRGSDFATPQETLLAMAAQSSRSGLSFPWDDYGYMRAKHALVGSYLAWKTGKQEPLRFLFETGAAFDTLHVGWGFDHRLWTLLYWPAGQFPKTKPTTSLNCANPTTHAVQESGSHKLHLLHIWDSSEWLPLRAHCNPGSLTVEYAGVPLIVEGRPWIAAPKRYSAAPFTIPNRYGGAVNIGRGSICAHNCIIVDGEDWFAPQDETRGKLIRASWLNNASYVCSDSTEVYAHYELNQVRRETLMLGEDYILVRDSIDADSPHTYRWVAHVPPGKVTITEESATYTSPQGMGIGFTNDSDNSFALLPTGRCNEISYEVTKSSARLHTTLSLQDTFEEHLDLSSGWGLTWAGTRAKAKSLACSTKLGETHDFSQGPWFYTTSENRPGWIVCRKKFTLQNLPTGVAGIRFPRHATEVEMMLNGKTLEVPLIADETELTLSFIDCSNALQLGENELIIFADSSVDFCPYGRITLGRIRDYLPRAQPEVYWHDAIEWITTPDTVAKAQIFVKQSETSGCAFNTTRVKNSVLKLEASEPVDVSWNSGGLSFGDSTSAVSIKFTMGEASGTAILGELANVTWLSKETVDVHFATKELNRGFPTQWANYALSESMPATPLVESAIPEQHSLESIYHQLASDDWKTQVLAMDAAQCIPDEHLIEAIKEKLQWEVQHHATSYEPQPDDPAWYRIKAAAARYLGSIGHEPAVPLLATLLQDRETMYPARVAAAHALNQIHSQEAHAALAEIESFDEYNVAMICRDILTNWNLSTQ